MLLCLTIAIMSKLSQLLPFELSNTPSLRTRRHTLISPILVVGLLIVVTIRGNWKLLDHAVSLSTRHMLAEEPSFKVPSSSWTFYNQSVVEHHHHQIQQQQHQQQHQRYSVATVDNATQLNVARKQARKIKTTTVEKTNVTRYYFLHIPKAGGNSMRDALNRKGVRVIDNGPHQHIRNFANWTIQHPNHHVFMSEGLGFNEQGAEAEPPALSSSTPLLHKNYVMFRDPQSHVLSQYFHCTESRGTKKKRKRLHKMPKTLHAWLQIWEETRRSKSLARSKLPVNAHRRWTDPRMRCYNPIDLQSWISGYPQSKPELEQKFAAIGILSDFHRSSCVFATLILNRVPLACNCSHASASIPSLNGTTSTDPRTMRRRTSAVKNNDDDDDDDDNNSIRSDGTLKMHKGQSHGVIHHGDSYQPTNAELQLIRNLTRHDQILYDNAKDLFHAKVADLEQQYQVTYCLSAPPRAKATGKTKAKPGGKTKTTMADNSAVQRLKAAKRLRSQ